MCVCVCLCPCPSSHLVTSHLSAATSRRVSRRVENRRLKVAFNQLFAEDEGNYTCTASINDDSISGIFTHTRQATLTVDKSELLLYVCNATSLCS